MTCEDVVYVKGDRIRYSEEGVRSFPNQKGKTGVVLGQSKQYLHCVRIKMDHLKTPKSIAKAFIEKIGEQ